MPASEHAENEVSKTTTDNTLTANPALANLLQTTGTATLHPIFARSNFTGLSDANYQRISPALLLASNIISSPRATLWYHTYLFGPQTPITDLRGRPRNVVHKIYQTYDDMPKVGWLSSQTTEMYISAMVSRTVKFSFLDTVLGQSHIMLNKQKLLDTILSPGRDQPYHAALGRYMVLASTLVHEIAHAVGHTRFGPGAEMLFEDDVYCEAGFAFESFVLGGKLNYLHMRANHDPVASVLDFLQIQTAVWQKVTDVYSMVSADHMPMRGKAPEVPEEYVMSKQTIEKFFDQAFWDGEVPKIKAGCMKHDSDGLRFLVGNVTLRAEEILWEYSFDLLRRGRCRIASPFLDLGSRKASPHSALCTI
ncbi:hypothetical protein LTR78_007415 [Recurvomyces mirabilis]|uniref:Uncharacterized protein n=1 Tax=Recurvomyces mirabilis TaxID=574656 RepID=A0AAE0WG38_9PEZI|nr:hypothetical protein LTR78_007415 [Recurvomyces mirabilis]KAK5160076.1 hypothetical protein LTS14_002182 [Recurvomyces mirabilis]